MGLSCLCRSVLVPRRKQPLVNRPGAHILRLQTRDGIAIQHEQPARGMWVLLPGGGRAEFAAQRRLVRRIRAHLHQHAFDCDTRLPAPVYRCHKPCSMPPWI